MRWRVFVESEECLQAAFGASIARTTGLMLAYEIMYVHC